MKFFKGLIITIVILGLGLIAAGFALGADFINISDHMMSDDDYTLVDDVSFTESIDNLVVDVQTRNVIIKPSDDENIHITYFEHEDDTWEVTLTNGELNISQDRQSGFMMGWFNWGWLSGDILTLTIEIPNTYAFDVDVITNTGKVEMSDFANLGTTSLESDTGTVKAIDLTVDSLKVKTDTGSIYVTRVTSTGDADIDGSTGSAHIKDSTFDAIDVNVNTGSIEIEDSIINKMDLQADTGSIDVSGVDLTNRTLRLSTDTGSVRVNGDSQGDSHNVIYDDPNFYINADTDTGSVNIDD